MKTSPLSAACRVALLTLLPILNAAPALAEPAVYELDPEHSTVHFEVLHFGTSTLRGRFGLLGGAVTLDRAARRGEVSLRVSTTSVSTGMAFFDARLRREDLLASTEFPEAYFVASRFAFEGDKLTEVRGEFTLRGISQPLSLRAERFSCRRHDGTEICGGDFQADILRSEFGATFGLPFVGDRVRLKVQVEGRRR